MSSEVINGHKKIDQPKVSWKLIGRLLVLYFVSVLFLGIIYYLIRYYYESIGTWTGINYPHNTYLTIENEILPFGSLFYLFLCLAYIKVKTGTISSVILNGIIFSILFIGITIVVGILFSIIECQLPLGLCPVADGPIVM